jgi:CRISPR-associated protein Csm4
MNCHIFYLKPSGNFKTPLRSDTLWGQLCWAIRMLYGETELNEMLTAYEEGDESAQKEKCFFISSAFPFLQKNREKPVLFFPKPLQPVPSTEELNVKSFPEAILKLRKQKKQKKKELQEQGLFHYTTTNKEATLFNLKAPKTDVFPMTHTSINRLTGSALVLYREKNDATATPVVNINLEKMDDFEELGQLYHTDDRALVLLDQHGKPQKNVETGFFFLAKGSDESIKKIKACLRFLSHFGMGGDRTIGKGRFEYLEKLEDAITIPEAEDANALMNLSLYRPTASELKTLEKTTDHRTLNYRTVVRKGKGTLWQRSLPQKRTLMMFEESSVFPITEPEKTVYGKIEQVGKHEAGFTIRHYGHAFMLKIKIK